MYPALTPNKAETRKLKYYFKRGKWLHHAVLFLVGDTADNTNISEYTQEMAQSDGTAELYGGKIQFRKLDESSPKMFLGICSALRHPVSFCIKLWLPVFEKISTSRHACSITVILFELYSCFSFLCFTD